MNDVRSLVNKDSVQNLPDELLATVAEMRGIVTELQTQRAVERLVQAAESAGEAADSVSASMTGVPELIEDMRTLTQKASALKLEDLVGSVTTVLDGINKLVDSDETRSIPPALTSALTEIQAALSELREGGAVANTNATLASARRAADAVADATEDLPALTRRLNDLVSKAENVISAYGTRSSFNTETVAALREVSAAAKAVAQLARTIERKPNALLLGR
jgi:paraquat-inducible protein B